MRDALLLVFANKQDLAGGAYTSEQCLTLSLHHAKGERDANSTFRNSNAAERSLRQARARANCKEPHMEG